MSKEIGGRKLYFIDSEDQLVVTGGCKVCRVTQADLQAESFQLVVSPSGLAHHANEYGDTDCGKDATRREWWWPL